MTPSLPSQQSALLFDSDYSATDSPVRGQLLTWIVVGLAVIGLVISGYLTWTTWSNGGVAGCGAGGAVDCEQVLKTHWSKWLGIPVSLLGLGTYLGILVSALMLTRDRQGIAATALLTFALLAAGSATWFIGLQVIQIGSFCSYCMAVHLCSLTICGLTVAMLRMGESAPSNVNMGAMFGANVPAETDYEVESGLSQVRPLLASGVAALGVTILMIGQFFFRPAEFEYVKIEKPATEVASVGSEPVASVTGERSPTELSPATMDEPEETTNPEDESIDSATEIESTKEQSDSSDFSASRMILFGGLQEPIDVTTVPILGNPDAEHVLLEMLDYTCPHCRNLHPHVEAAIERYGDQLAFVVFHVPLSKKCNPYVKRDHWSHKHACDYAQLALSVYRLDRSKFGEFHHFLMDSKRPPVVAEARRIAMNLVGEEVLLDENLKAKSLSSFAGNSDEMKKMNTGLPLILTTDGMLKGVPRTEERFFNFLEEVLGVEPVETQ